MPRKKSLIAEVAPPPEATVLPEVPYLLSLSERTALRAMLTSPVFKKALHNARLRKPPLAPSGLDSALGGIIANNRLHQLQGWAMFEASLGKEVEDPKLAPPKATDDYMRER
jgi:hypothetical protein